MGKAKALPWNRQRAVALWKPLCFREAGDAWSLWVGRNLHRREDKPSKGNDTPFAALPTGRGISRHQISPDLIRKFIRASENIWISKASSLTRSKGEAAQGSGWPASASWNGSGGRALALLTFVSVGRPRLAKASTSDSSRTHEYPHAAGPRRLPPAIFISRLCRRVTNAIAPLCPPRLLHSLGHKGQRRRRSHNHVRYPSHRLRHGGHPVDGCLRRSVRADLAPCSISFSARSSPPAC